MERYKRELENLGESISEDIGESFYYLENDSAEWGTILTIETIVRKHIARLIKSLNPRT